MNDQNDQNKPSLSLDEELDVLEAVYTVGKEKGLDLLRPEQLRKLMASGRIKQHNHQVTSSIAEHVTKQLLLQLGGDMTMDERKKVFETTYGAQPADFYKTLENNLFQVRNDA